ncbi:MAG: hypothetical protein IKL80_02250 [Clostridia bacterium]|nr:hypothetical protein [Clostridia bacterium]
MKNIYPEWEGFVTGRWCNEEIDVREFIQLNYTPYEGDDSFLCDATDATKLAAGELRLFDYYKSEWWCHRSNTNRTQIVVKDGGVYQIGDAYYPGCDATEENLAYNTEIVAANTLKADEWYTFVRVMDFRDDACYYDKVFVYDSEGALVGNSSSWKKAGKLNKVNDALPIAFVGKGFDNGENIQFDDFKIANLSSLLPTAEVSSDTTGYTDMGAALYNDGDTMQYMGTRKYLRRSPMNTYSLDLLLPSVGEATEQVDLFSLNPAQIGNDASYFNHRYNALTIKGGQVYASYYDKATDTKTETALTFAGNNVVLEARKWYNITYSTDITAGTYTVTIKDVATDEVVATVNGTGANTYKLDVSSSTGAPVWSNTRFTIFGAVGFDAPVLFDNIVVDSKNADGTYATKSYQSMTYNLDSGAVGTSVRELIDVNMAVSLGLAADDKCVIFNKANALITGIPFATPAEVLPIKINGISADSFTYENILLYDGETELYEALDLTSATGTIAFKGLEAGKTYVLKLSGLEFAAEPFKFRMADQSCTIAIAEGVFEVKSLGLSGGVAALPATGDISGAVSISNATSADQPIALILALYSDEEGLLDVAVWSDTVEAGDTTYAEATEALSVAGADYAKVMLWDGFQTLAPLTVDVQINPAAAQ